MTQLPSMDKHFTMLGFGKTGDHSDTAKEVPITPTGWLRLQAPSSKGLQDQSPRAMLSVSVPSLG